jgi:hypothetical protein
MNAARHRSTPQDARGGGDAVTAGAARRAALLALVLGATLLAGQASALRAPAGPETFASPEEAAAALATAWRGGHSTDLLRIFGPAGLPLVRSGDRVADHRARSRLAAAYDLNHRIAREEPREAVLVVGREAWPYPIPIVQKAGRWRFDVTIGAQEIIDRRVGRNELHAIDTVRAYVEAQREFAEKAAARNGVREYARKLASDPGQRNGLYWPPSGAGDESPLGPWVAAAEAHGYGPPADSGRQPYRGYVFRILTAQGEHASGGARAYLVDGRMTGGFALLAFPARYGDSGIMTFIVNQNGVAFQKNLGPDTERIAAAMTAYDPDPSWSVVTP